MKTIQTQRKSQGNWDKMAHAPFKKVVKFDLICMGRHYDGHGRRGIPSIRSLGMFFSFLLYTKDMKEL